MSSKRSTQTTNTFVSGPRGGKDFPVDDLFVFTKGLNYMKHSEWIKHRKWHHLHCCQHSSDSSIYSMSNFTFLADSRFSEWLGNSSSVRLCCLSKPGMRSALWSASTVVSLCTDDSSGGQQKISVNHHSLSGVSSHKTSISSESRKQMLTRTFCERWNDERYLCQSIGIVQNLLLPIEDWTSCVLRSSCFLYNQKSST